MRYLPIPGLAPTPASAVNTPTSEPGSKPRRVSGGAPPRASPADLLEAPRLARARPTASTTEWLKRRARLPVLREARSPSQSIPSWGWLSQWSDRVSGSVSDLAMTSVFVWNSSGYQAADEAPAARGFFCAKTPKIFPCYDEAR